MAMNAVEKLLKIDAGKLKTPEKIVKMSLRKLGLQEFEFPCKAVDPEYVSELQENSIEFHDGDIDRIKTYDAKVLTIVEGCPEVFKSKEMRDHFGAATPKDLVSKLLVSGEIDFLKKEIDALGGYDGKSRKSDEEEVKN